MIGSTLSHYSIEAELGRGGMGIVYKAHDTKLDRTVAIKVLPSAALATEDDRERFYREAKSAAALNHPNIAQVYQIDEAVPSDAPHGTEPSPFIAMEYIEGGTLEERIKQGPLKLKVAVRIGINVAEALKTAHAKNIVHRDIKAANIMLAEGGEAKVLDFGLAKTAQSTKLTRMGSTLGTVAYMSPEQARGDEVDARTDLYSLGTVLYEMVAGRLPFGGEYEQAVVYGIMNEEPEPLTALRTGVPMDLERIVNKLMAKDPGRRYQSCADLIVDLESLTLDASTVSRSQPAFSTIGPAPASSATSSPGKPRSFWGIVAAAVLLGLVTGLLGSGLLEPEPALKPLQRVQIMLPGIAQVRFPQISPDGKYLAFTGEDQQGVSGIYLKELDTGRLRLIEQTSSAWTMESHFSPDGSRMAFTEFVNGGIFTVGVPSGIPERQTDRGRLAYWEDNDTIIIMDDRPGGEGISRLDLRTGETTPIPLDGPELSERANYLVKTRVPESDRVFGHELARADVGNVVGDHRIFTADLSSGKLEIIEPFAVNPEYVRGGFLLYQIRNDAGKMVVRPVDPETGQFTGQPVDVLEDGLISSYARHTVSSNGDLLFTTGDPSGNLVSTLWKVDLDENQNDPLTITVPEGYSASAPVFSPQGSEVMFQVGRFGREDIHELDLDESLQYQITSDGASINPEYDPADGSRWFTHRGGGSRAVYRMEPGLPDGQPAEMMRDNANMVSLSPDGRWMAHQRRDSVAARVVMVMTDRTTGQAVWADSAGVAAFAPDFSADSRYLVFNRETPTGIELVVVSVSGPPGYVIPNTQGLEPKWSSDGQYLLFQTPNGIERLPIRTQPVFNVLGEPELILPMGRSLGWDISPDGRMLVVAASQVSFTNTERETMAVQWYQNWSDHLKKVFER